MKRIIFFGIKTFPSRGGTDRVAENLVDNLKDRYHITVYCFKDPAAQNYIPGIRVVEFKRWLPGSAGVLIYFIQSFFHAFLFGKADLIHIHKTESTLFAPLLRLRFKIVATSHEAQYKSDKWNGFARIFFHVVERFYIWSSHTATCISKPLAEYYSAKFNKKVAFIPNGVNEFTLDGFDIEVTKKYLPEGASLETPFILFASRRLMKIKGCHLMLEALHKIGYAGQVFITGELHTREDYMRQLKKSSAGLNVFFLGFVESLPALLGLVSKASLFVFPSETEGMSIMLLEVASVGTPIIASDIPENKQVFNGEEVLYFKSKDADDLAKKITYALEHPDQMNELGSNSRRRVFSDYLWRYIADLYARVYDNVMNN